jgi:hypothetical protein
MPFTPTHVAAIVPIAAVARRALPFSALVIGSMIPDFPLFVPLSPSYATTHSISGIFVACVPLGLVCLLVFQCLMKRPLFAILPDAIRCRCAHLSSSCVTLNLSFLGSSALAVAIGAATHVFWDSFTHAGRWGTTVFPVLNDRVFNVGSFGVPGYKALQYGSSVVFLPLLFILLGLWLVRQKPVPLAGLPGLAPVWRAAVCLMTLIMPVIVALLSWMVDQQTPYMKLGRAITVSGLAVGIFMVLYCALYQIAWTFGIGREQSSRYQSRRVRR